MSASRSASAVAAALWMLCAPGVPGIGSGAGVAHAQEGDTRQRLDDLVKDRAEAEARAAERAERAGDLLADVRSIDSRLLSAGRKREALRDDEAALEQEYELHLARIELIQSEYRRARALLSERLASIYKRGRLGNNRALLQAATSAEPLRMARYLAAVSRTDTGALSDYETVRRRHELALVELDTRKRTLTENKQALEHEQARYEQARNEKTILMARLEKDSEADRTLQEQLLAAETELRAILEASAELPEYADGDDADEDAGTDSEAGTDESAGDAEAALTDPTRRGRPNYLRPPSRSRRRRPRDPFPERKGSLEAPVGGEVVSRYGEKRSSGRIVQGVVIRAGKDVQVASVAGGEVVFSGPFPGLGNTIIISHGDRYHTVYAHLEVLQHEVGERVRTNEVVGTLPKGEPILHFELRAEGKAVDPVAWFDGGYAAFDR